MHDERAPKKCTNNTSGTMHWRACAVPKTNCYNMHVNVHMALLPLLPLSTTCTMKWLQLSLRKSHNVFRRLFWLVLATLAATNWKYLNRDCLFKQHRSTAVAQKRRATHGHTTHTHTHTLKTKCNVAIIVVDSTLCPYTMAFDGWLWTAFWAMPCDMRLIWG